MNLHHMGEFLRQMCSKRGFAVANGDLLRRNGMGYHVELWHSGAVRKWRNGVIPINEWLNTHGIAIVKVDPDGFILFRLDSSRQDA